MTMSRCLAPLAAPLLTAWIAACDVGGPVACTGSVEPAVVVEIRDARTGVPLAERAAGAVREGAFVDSLTPYAFLGSDPSSMYSRRAANERPGRYEVEVQLAGYLPWAAGDVRVADGQCHVRTVTLQARLQPAP